MTYKGFLYELTPLVPSARELVLLAGGVAAVKSTRTGSGACAVPQRPEAVLVQPEISDAASVCRRHTDGKEEA